MSKLPIQSSNSVVISESTYEAAFICCIIYPYHLGPGLTNFLVMQTEMLQGIWEIKKTFGVNLCICKIRNWMCLIFHAVIWVRSSSLLPQFLFFIMNFELPKNTFSVTQFKEFTERFISVLRSWCNFQFLPHQLLETCIKKASWCFYINQSSSTEQTTWNWKLALVSISQYWTSGKWDPTLIIHIIILRNLLKKNLLHLGGCSSV